MSAESQDSLVQGCLSFCMFSIYPLARHTDTVCYFSCACLVTEYMDIVTLTRTGRMFLIFTALRRTRSTSRGDGQGEPMRKQCTTTARASPNRQPINSDPLPPELSSDHVAKHHQAAAIDGLTEPM